MKDDDAQYEDLRELDNLSLSLGDIERIAVDEKYQQKFETKYSGNLYASILLILTHERFEEDEAWLLWRQIKKHLSHMTEALGRNPGISVAMLDYLTNIRCKLSGPVVIEEEKSEFISETATRDEMTTLYLRSIFDITLTKAIDEYKRDKVPLCLLLIDIDDFKQVNDTYGHLKGDEVLKEIGKLVNDNIREMDMGARYGGEEMAVIMPGADVSESLLVAERIRKRIEKLRFDGITVTVSIGISQASQENNCLAKLIKAADDALYKAKKNGKNQIKVSSGN